MIYYDLKTCRLLPQCSIICVPAQNEVENYREVDIYVSKTNNVLKRNKISYNVEQAAENYSIFQKSYNY
jgi:hypothetical protein